MAIENGTIVEQLVMLRNLTRLTGGIHEAQLFQLKLWPFLLYPKIKVKYELRIDQDKKIVEYLLHFPSKTAPKGIAKKLESLELDMQWLLGSEWILKVSVEKRGIFSGSRRVEPLINAEKKSYGPFIKAINEYVGRSWQT